MGQGADSRPRRRAHPGGTCDSSAHSSARGTPGFRRRATRCAGRFRTRACPESERPSPEAEGQSSHEPSPAPPPAGGPASSRSDRRCRWWRRSRACRRRRPSPAARPGPACGGLGTPPRRNVSPKHGRGWTRIRDRAGAALLSEPGDGAGSLPCGEIRLFGPPVPQRAGSAIGATSARVDGLGVPPIAFGAKPATGYAWRGCADRRCTG